MSTDSPTPEVSPGEKKGISKWTIAWLAWGFTFLIIEGIALFNKEEGDTLSEKIRDWGGIKTPQRKGAQWIVFIAFLIFVVWFPIHILTGVI